MIPFQPSKNDLEIRFLSFSPTRFIRNSAHSVNASSNFVSLFDGQGRLNKFFTSTKKTEDVIQLYQYSLFVVVCINIFAYESLEKNWQTLKIDFFIYNLCFHFFSIDVAKQRETERSKLKVRHSKHKQEIEMFD